ncbi:MAG: sulfatase-like hydrolase/transferase [Planctomycetota bacterium]
MGLAWGNQGCLCSRNRLLAAIACWAACGSGAFAAEPAAAVRPAPRNVVLIISDDQHWRDYGFMGHSHLRTPHLDRLARESLVYRFGHVPSSLCCPSLASIITGRLPHEHRIVGNDPPEDPVVPRSSPAGRAAFAAGREQLNQHLEEWPLLPRLLGDRGYRSLQTGKWWQGDFTRGGFTAGMTKGVRHGDAGLTIGRQTLTPVYDFLGRCRGEEKPFFIWYAPLLPHDPHDPPQPLVDHYASKTDSLHVARYWGNVERFDQTVGDLLDHLDRERLAADTLVVFIADNGWIQSRDAPGFAPRSKLSPYEGGLRTPIMLRQPGTLKPRCSDALASGIDILPTVLAACGVPAPDGLPGVNLLDDKAVATRRQIFGECFTHTLVDLDNPAASLLWRWTIRDDELGEQHHRWKLIVPTSAEAEGKFPAGQAGQVDPHSREQWRQGAVELFDLANDPDEMQNLAAAQPQRVKELAQSLTENWSP